MPRRASKGDDLRSENLSTRVTGKERAELKQQAAAANLTLSAYLAHRLSDLRTRTKLTTTFDALLNAELARIANNAGQLIRPLPGMPPLPDEHPLVTFSAIIEATLLAELRRHREDGTANDNRPTDPNEKRARTTSISTRVTKDFYDHVHAQAAASGIDKVSQFIHAQLFGRPTIVRTVYMMEDKAFTELRSLGDTINVLARSKNRGRPATNSTVLAAFKAVFNLLKGDPLMHSRIEAAIVSTTSEVHDRTRTQKRSELQGAQSLSHPR